MIRVFLTGVIILAMAGCGHPLGDEFPGESPSPETIPTGMYDVDETMAEAQPFDDEDNQADPLVLGHRGRAWNVEGNNYPENTRLSVEAALAAGADGVEVDLIKSADGVFVLRHDNFLRTRTPGGDCRSSCGGHITQKTWSELETCLAHAFDEDDYRVPLDRLEFILDLPMRLLLLDIKNDQMGIEVEETLEGLASVLDDQGPPVMLMLYNIESVERAGELGFDACLKQHQHVAEPEAFAQRVILSGAKAVCMYEQVITRQSLRDLHEGGVDVFSYSLCSDDGQGYVSRLTELAQWGVSAMITDLIPQTQSVLDSLSL